MCRRSTRSRCPGGYIYITRGILPFLNDEAELAGVLGHEIGHVTARHSAQQYTRAVGGTIGLVALGVFVPGARPFGQLAEQALGVLFLKYGREDELQADQLGARYAARGNWDPAGVPDMLSTLGRLDEASGQRRGVPNWLYTHPEPLARVKEIQPTVQQLSAGRTDLVRNRDAMLRARRRHHLRRQPGAGDRARCLVPSPAAALPDRLPERVGDREQPEQVVAKAPGADVYMLLEQVQMPRGNGVENIARAQMQNAGFRIVSGSRDQVNGLDAFVGLYQGPLEGLGNVRDARRAHRARRATCIWSRASRAEHFRSARRGNPRRASARSSRSRAAEAQPSVRIASTSTSCGRATPGSRSPSVPAASSSPPTLAVMNGAEPQLAAAWSGTRIKIVVGG